MLKKAACLISAVLLAVSLSACGSTTQALPTLSVPGEESTASTASGEETSSAVETEPVKMEDCENNLDGLCTYLEGNNAVTGERHEMSYQEIGATGGYRYRFTFNKQTVQVEVYAFDLDNLNEKGQACVSSVKEKGFFTMLDNEVPAVLSDNGRYMMIYTDAGDDEVSTTQKETVLQLFKGFYA